MILRPFLNDVFFTFLKSGEPGPIASIGSLQQLTLSREALRLGSLLGNLILRSALFLVLLWLIGRAVIGMVQIKPGRLDEVLGRFLNGRLLPLLLFGMTFGVLACVARYCLDAVPHIPDETAYLFQAKIFAQGKLWAPVPHWPEFFRFEHIIMHDGRWFSKYPPFFSLLLALGVGAGVPWLVNPLLGAVSGLFIFLLTERITGSRGWGVLAWLLLLTSPFFLFINASMMSHALALLLTLLFIYLLFRGLDSNAIILFLLSGLCVGTLILTRPFTALLVFIPAAVYVIGVALFKGRPAAGFKHLMAIGIGMLPFLIFIPLWHHIYLPDNRGVFDFFYTAYHEADRLGFGADKGAGWMLTWGTWGHTPAKGLRSIYNFLSYTSQYLFGWPWRLSFAFVGVGLIFGRHRVICWPLFGMVMCLAAGHLFYWCSQHIGYGARLILPTVCGLIFLRDRLAESISNRAPGQRAASFFLGLILLGLVGWNLIGYLPERLKEGRNYANVNAGLKERVEEMDLDRALIFVKTENLLYNDGFFMNDPFMNKTVIFARDLGERNQTLMAEYPEYDVYYWDKRVLTKIIRERAADPRGPK